MNITGAILHPEELALLRAMTGPDEKRTPSPALMPPRRVTAEMLVAQAPVRLAYVAQTGDKPKRPLLDNNLGDAVERMSL